MKEAKEMTILDLINKSVTDEEMPKEVKFEGWTYKYNRDDNDYFCNNYNNDDECLFEITTHYLDTVTIPKTESAEERKLKALDEFVSKLREIK